MAGVTINTVDGAFIIVNSINQAATGNPIAGVTGKIIRVYRMFFTVTTASGTITFTDGVTTFTGALVFAANGQLILPFDGNPYFTCGAGNPFTMTCSSTGQVSGAVYFTQQPI